APDRVVPDQGGDVQGDAEFLEFLEKGGDIRLRCAAVAGDDGGDPHAQEVFRHGQFGKILGMRMHVDEAGGDHLPGGVGDRPTRTDILVDGGEAAILVGDLRGTGGTAGSIDKTTVDDDHSPV